MPDKAEQKPNLNPEKPRFVLAERGHPIGAGMMLFALGIGAGFTMAFTGLGFLRPDRREGC